ncbi:nitronate monooxygenase [Herbihabitans rhizosphaerae]|uniref:Nitronate monooxygenase n=1 Tax=Herbihabitans rhizosphaerae TaxID=1872711 RepID=A0A4Q7KBD9_9PSEU|nr:nitronate monooxygenase [Herbihabitans rhizosphaerae]RZS29482.1 nitronate monooxygenase [Herbihabitans rhizosphaerae]
MRTWLTERFGLTVPVVGAPMARASGSELATAISAAGALGMIGVGGGTKPEWIREQAARVAASGRPYGIGLMAWALPRVPEQIDAVLDAHPALVSVSFGDYSSTVDRLRDAGITVATQAGTVADARAAEDAGVDLIVARGGEAGGHGRDAVATLPLLQGILDAVDTPVLAAGGIATARGLAAVLAAGAAGAWVGTAFLACRETATSAAKKRRLVETEETGTAYSTTFDAASGLGWPEEFGGRAVRNAFFDRWVGREAELAEDPGARAEFAAAWDNDDLDTTSLYAGQGVGLLTSERSAAEVVADFADAERLLREAADRL